MQRNLFIKSMIHLRRESDVELHHDNLMWLSKKVAVVKSLYNTSWHTSDVSIESFFLKGGYVTHK